MILRSVLLAFISVVWLSLTAGGSTAHQRTASGPQSGIAIPEISHGEMVMMAEYRGRIIDLAARATDTNEHFRRVLNYEQIQYAYCFWGKMPGGVTDETSPFNECSHAYLAATKAVLLLMRDMPREADAAGEIVSAIDAGMVLRGLSLITCAFSGEAFNTADIVRPDLTAIPAHPASVGALAGCGALVGTALLAFRRLLRPAAP